MRPKHQIAAAAVLVAAAVACTACGTSQVIGNLGLAVDAVSVALPLIGPAAGLPANTQAQIQQYLAATNTAIGQASDILAGPGTDGQKAAQIFASFSGIAVPAVPAKYQGIAQAVQQVSVLVARFLSGLPPATAQPLGVRAGGMNRPTAAVVPGKTTVLSAGDLVRLAAIKQKALTQAR